MTTTRTIAHGHESDTDCKLALAVRHIVVTLSVALLSSACASENYPPHNRIDAFRGGETFDPNTPKQEENDAPEEPVAAPFPETLASGQVNPRNLIVRNESLYWVDTFQGAVRLNWSYIDGGATVSVATLPSLPASIASDDHGLYLAGNAEGKILFANHLELTVQVLHTSSSGPRAIALTEGDVYWAAGDGCLYRGAKEGGEVQSIACGSGLPTSLAIDTDRAYWTNEEGTLFESPLEPEGAGVKLASNQVFGDRLVADAGSVYWVDASHRELRRYERSSSQVSVLAGSAYAPAGLTQDRFYLYFTTEGDNAIKRIRKIGGDVSVLADGQDEPGEIVVDNTWVYWLNQGDGTVMRLAKPI